jgi:hypothetical protein
MSDEGQSFQKATAELDRMLIGHQPGRSELDEAIAWRDRFIAWEIDRMRDDECTEEQIEAMVAKVLDMPYAFWIRAMARAAPRLSGDDRLTGRRPILRSRTR